MKCCGIFVLLTLIKLDKNVNESRKHSFLGTHILITLILQFDVIAQSSSNLCCRQLCKSEKLYKASCSTCSGIHFSVVYNFGGLTFQNVANKSRVTSTMPLFVIKKSWSIQKNCFVWNDGINFVSVFHHTIESSSEIKDSLDLLQTHID